MAFCDRSKFGAAHVIGCLLRNTIKQLTACASVAQVWRRASGAAHGRPERHRV